jgi:hypothetical protein
VRARFDGGSLERGGVDRLPRFLDHRRNIMAMEAQRGRGGTSLSGGFLGEW